MAQPESDRPPGSEPLAYALPDLNRRRPPVSFFTIGVVSLCVGCLSLLIDGWHENMAIRIMLGSAGPLAVEQAKVDRVMAVARASATRPAPRGLNPD